MKESGSVTESLEISTTEGKMWRRDITGELNDIIYRYQMSFISRTEILTRINALLFFSCFFHWTNSAWKMCGCEGKGDILIIFSSHLSPVKVFIPLVDHSVTPGVACIFSGISTNGGDLSIPTED